MSATTAVDDRAQKLRRMLVTHMKECRVNVRNCNTCYMLYDKRCSFSSNHQAGCCAFKLHLIGEYNTTTLDILNSTCWFHCKSVFSKDFTRYLNEVLKVGFRLSSTYAGLLDAWVNVVMQRFIVESSILSQSPSDFEVALVQMLFRNAMGFYDRN